MFQLILALTIFGPFQMFVSLAGKHCVNWDDVRRTHFLAHWYYCVFPVSTGKLRLSVSAYSPRGAAGAALHHMHS